MQLGRTCIRFLFSSRASNQFRVNITQRESSNGPCLDYKINRNAFNVQLARVRRLQVASPVGPGVFKCTELMPSNVYLSPGVISYTYILNIHIYIYTASLPGTYRNETCTLVKCVKLGMSSVGVDPNVLKY